MDWDIHGWLKALSPDLKKDDFRKLLDKRSHITDKPDRELMDSILEVSFGTNKKVAIMKQYDLMEDEAEEYI